MNQGSSFVKWFATLPHVVASLYHGGFADYRDFVELLVEGLDDACFTLFCPLMSTVVYIFRSVLLSRNFNFFKEACGNEHKPICE